MLLATSSPGENGSSGRSRTGMVFFTKEVHCSLCHGGMKLVLPRGLAPRSFAFARRHARLLHLGSLKRMHHAGAAPAHAVWKTAMRAATSMMLDWWLNSELRRTLLGFSEALICLSYSALKHLLQTNEVDAWDIDEARTHSLKQKS